ncbi:hypothetical protein NQ176_g3388 [Zarea fungicola]|uniref:Uncharacterized protein n=1 Tax=Zarea fungicola TaxID=93591 RepID=A0ACC1NIV2_9HYPO|nr:hypothetical protein NQ176_g3388 [Lecanicillium fungicola]
MQASDDDPCDVGHIQTKAQAKSKNANQDSDKGYGDKKEKEMVGLRSQLRVLEKENNELQFRHVELSKENNLLREVYADVFFANKQRKLGLDHCLGLAPRIPANSGHADGPSSPVPAVSIAPDQTLTQQRETANRTNMVSPKTVPGISATTGNKSGSPSGTSMTSADSRTVDHHQRHGFLKTVLEENCGDTTGAFESVSDEVDDTAIKPAQPLAPGCPVLNSFTPLPSSDGHNDEYRDLSSQSGSPNIECRVLGISSTSQICGKGRRIITPEQE